jgi:NNP family nitrate/nitrite transporter-like MFS transporter
MALRRGHWPTLIGSWLHLTVSFMVWLLLGALSVALAEDLHLTETQTAIVVALPILGGALLRIVAGWSSDWFGAKPTAVVILLCEFAVVSWGWIGVARYEELLALALLLGIGGASFAVTLPLAGRAYQSAHQGLVLGLVASGNIGTVLILFLAPRGAQAIGWHGVFGAMLVPIALTLLSFMAMAGDDRQGVRHQRDVEWWHHLAQMIKQPKAYWLCLLYGVTFGGFVGFCSILPVYFHDQYRMDGVTAGSLAALCGLVGSVIRPLGGHAADRFGGLPVLVVVFPVLLGLTAIVGLTSTVTIAVGAMVLAVGAMGVGNGVLFQLVSEWFPKEIGIASGVVGAAGGIGGFLLPVWMGLLKESTGTFQAGIWLFAVVVVGAWALAAWAQRQVETTSSN